MKTKMKFASIYEVYKITLELSGEHVNNFKKSLLLFTLSFIAQGLAFSMFYPFLKSLFATTLIINDIWLYFILMLFFSGISFIAKWKGHDFDYAGNIVEITHDIRTKLGISLRTMPLEKLSSYKTGELNAVFSSNVDETVLHMGMMASLFLQIVIVPFIIVIATFIIDYRLALIMLILFPLTIPLYAWKRKLAIEEKTQFTIENASLEAGFIEYIQGLSVLRAVNKIGINAQNLQNSIKNVREIQKQGLYKGQLPFVLMGILIEFTLLAILFIGSWFIKDNSLALVTLGASIIIVARLTEPLSLLLGVIPMFDLMDSAFRKIKSILEIKPLTIYEPIQKNKNFDIEFKNVDFTYLKQNKKAINNINLYIPNQSMTAIVGHSGCGKTTLAKLIMRYADIQKGTIKIGGANIKNMTPENLMKNISVVFQDIYLFDDTIMNNIRMANLNATDKEVKDAANSAYCHEFITRLPNGYNTKIGDIGGNLSGGEKQRISIARAILKNAPIVILDEPTAALDTQSEVAVHRAIDKLVKDKTVIVIAHRLSTITGANNILVVHNGEIIENGTHNELIKEKGRYFSMWQAQQRVKEWNINE